MYIASLVPKTYSHVQRGSGLQ